MNKITVLLDRDGVINKDVGHEILLKNKIFKRSVSSF